MNFINKHRELMETKQHFSLRKFKIGTVSVLLGATLFIWGGTGSNAKADTVVTPEQTSQKLNNRDQVNQQQTQLAVNTVQKQLGEKGEVQADQALTIDRTIQYQEQGTNKMLHPDVNQDVSIVPYYKIGQVTIHYIDKTNNQSLGNDSFNGYVGIHVSQAQGEELINAKTNELNEQGYQLDANGFTQRFMQPNQPQFTESLQEYKVFYIHGQQKEDKTIPGSQTVEYVDEDGNKLREDSVTPFTFKTTNRIIDSVTGNEIAPGKWEVTSHDFGKVMVPEIDGYTPVSKDVDGAVITLEQPKKTIKVVYQKRVIPVIPVKTKGSVMVEYYDQTMNKLIKRSNTLEGNVNEEVDYDPTTEIQKLEESHYDLVSNGFKPGTTFVENNGRPMVYRITFKHQLKAETESRGAKQIIHYRMSDNTKAPKDNQQTFNFTRSKITDLVTNKVSYSNWNTTDHPFEKIKSPEVQGYTPDQEQAGGFNATPNDLEKEYIVTYTKEAAKEVTITIEYIDGTTGNVLDTDESSGIPGKAINYKTADKINDYENKGYQLIEDGFNVTMYPDQPTTYQVILGHGLTPVSPVNPGQPTINPGIAIATALYAAASPQVTKEQPTTYYAVVKNGQILAQDLDEQQAKSKLLDVVSPTIPGYRLVDDRQKLIDQMLIDAKSNKHTTITVYYTKDKVEPGQPDMPTVPETPIVPETPVNPTIPEQPDKVTPPTSESIPTPETVIPSTQVSEETPEVPKTSNSETSIEQETSKNQSGNYSVNTQLNQTKANKIEQATQKHQSQLPQTGNQKYEGIFGAAILTSLLGIFGWRRKEN